MRLKILALFLQSLVSFPVFTQEKVVKSFKMEVAGIKIGHITVTQVQNGNSVQYYLNSDAEAWALIKLKAHYNLAEFWLNGKFLSSSVHSSFNRQNFKSLIKRSEKGLEANCQTLHYEYDGPVNDVFSWTMVQLYFNEPRHGDKVLAENFGKVYEIKQTKPHHYEVNINKNKHLFIYRNGELIAGEIENPVKNFTFKKVN